MDGGARKRIAFRTDRDRNWQVYTMNADGTDQTRRTTNAVAGLDPA